MKLQINTFNGSKVRGGGRTDGPTDRPTLGNVEILANLKKEVHHNTWRGLGDKIDTWNFGFK